MRISDWSSDVCSSDLDSLSPKIRPCLARAGSPKHYASGSGRRQALELSAYIFGRWILRTHLMKQRTGSAASEGRHRGGIAKAHDLHFGVEYWPEETILSHPDFPEARRVYLYQVLALSGDDILLNKLLMEAARTVI